MKFLEKNLEDILSETPQELIQERGLHCFMHHKLYRQVNCGVYGISDLVSVYSTPRNINGCRYLTITIYELKQQKIDAGAFLQALGYQKAIARYISSRNLKNTFVQYRIVLIGSELDKKGNFCFLPDFTENTLIYTYEYEFSGISFKKERGYFNKGESTHGFRQLARDFARSHKPIPEEYREYYPVESADSLPF